MLRNFVFTINNPLQNGGPEICDWLEQNCSYVIIGCERGIPGPFTGKAMQSLQSRVDGLLSLGMNFAGISSGEWEVKPRLFDTVKKDGNFHSCGKRREQGSRGDLDRIRRIADEDGMRAVCMAGNVQQIRIAEKYLSYNESGRDWKPYVTWIYGDSGTGKSKMAREISGEDVYTKNVGTKWWDGYDGHEDVIVDDFRDSWWPITYMLALLDRYPMIVEYKGWTKTV